MKQVFFLLPSLATGGAQRLMLHLLSRFDRTKFQPILVVLMNRGPFLPLIPPDVEVIELNVSRSRNLAGKFVPLVWKRRPAMIISTLDTGRMLGLIRPLLPRDTLVVQRLAMTPKVFLKNTHRLRKRLAWRVSLELSCALSDTVICLSDAMVADVKQALPILPKTLRRIYNGTDTAGLSKRSLPSVPRPKGAHPWMVSVGRLHHGKGYDLLLNALSMLTNEIPRFHMTIIGDGPEQAALQEIIDRLGLTEQVELLGFRDNPHSYYLSADFVILPSRQEGFSNTLIEAIGLGTPVVATDCPGSTREVVSEGINGWIAPNEDSAGLAKAILRATQEFSHIDSRAIREDVERRFSLTHTVTQYEQLLPTELEPSI